jgi:hypothetical protein
LEDCTDAPGFAVQWKIPPHPESVVEINRDEAEVWKPIDAAASTRRKCDRDSGN